MKKLPVVFILFLIVSFLHAQEIAIPPNMLPDVPDGNSSKPDTGNNKNENENREKEPEEKKFRLKNRMVELSLMNFSFSASNNLIAAGNILKETATVSFDDFLDGFKLDFDMAFKPLSVNFNWKDQWGVGLDIAHTEASGNMLLSGKMMRLEEGEETFGIGAAVFTDIGIPVFFHVNKVKIKIRPAVYVPLVYTEPSITYTRKNVSKDGITGMYIDVNYDMRIYSPINIKSMRDNGVNSVTSDLQDNYRNIFRENLGYDFRLGAEYPLNDNLDIGVDIVNIPIPFAGAKLNHYYQIKGSAFLDTSMIDLDTISDGNLPDDFWDNVYGYEEPQYSSGYDQAGKKLYRPFKMLVYGNYRPFDSLFLTLIPSAGFSINYLYPKPAAIEGGLYARFDFANIFITTFGCNYNDRKWKNSMDIVLNLRALEIDLGLSSQSQNFIKSFQGAGAGVNFGIKLGW